MSACADSYQRIPLGQVSHKACRSVQDAKFVAGTNDESLRRIANCSESELTGNMGTATTWLTSASAQTMAMDFIGMSEVSSN